MDATQSDALKTAIHALELYANRHPRPPHVTMTQAAHMLDLSRQTVRKLVHSGALRLNGCGLIPIEQVDKILLSKSP